MANKQAKINMALQNIWSKLSIRLMQKKREKKTWKKIKAESHAEDNAAKLAANDLKEIFVSSGPSDAAGLQELPSFFLK